MNLIQITPTLDSPGKYVRRFPGGRKRVNVDRPSLLVRLRNSVGVRILEALIIDSRVVAQK